MHPTLSENIMVIEFLLPPMQVSKGYSADKFVKIKKEKRIMQLAVDNLSIARHPTMIFFSQIHKSFVHLCVKLERRESTT